MFCRLCKHYLSEALKCRNVKAGNLAPLERTPLGMTDDNINAFFLRHLRQKPASFSSQVKSQPGKSYRRGRLSTVGLLALTCLRSAHFKNENIIYLFYQTSYLNLEVNGTEPSPSVRLPWPSFKIPD
jgi:hypothetical protein